MNLKLKAVIFIIGILFLETQSYAQNSIKGSVIDKATQQPLAGAHILTKDSHVYAITKEDGTFELKAQHKIKTFWVEYIGYKSRQIEVDRRSFKVVLEASEDELDEVLLLGAYRYNIQRQSKPLASLDEHLNEMKDIGMIRRGAYAWEPSMNDMTSERLSITIDGMQVFGACTDKMDPVTSYIDIANLHKAETNSGQEGAVFGNAIGGSLNLVLNSGKFDDSGWSGSLASGYETNNKQRIFSGKIGYEGEKWYTHSNLTYRKADDYKSGKSHETMHSSFDKVNVETNGGYKIEEGKRVEASFLFDRSWDVGFPGLTMDVKEARAIIGSISYTQDFAFWGLTDWETKLYLSNVRHEMDDTTRPDSRIHMDMPGWTSTFGMYSQASLVTENHQFFFKIDGFANKTLARMDMYPINQDYAVMKMLSWPDVRVKNMGMYVQDNFMVGEGTINLSTRLSLHHNRVNSDRGLSQNRIFSPDMSRDRTLFLFSGAIRYLREVGKFQFNTGIGYGQRAPSVSEAYGYYLYNNNDKYEYMGNPDLKKEESVEADFAAEYNLSKLTLKVDAKYFRVYNYIMGILQPQLIGSVMNIGYSQGIKYYENLTYAELYNMSLSSSYKLLNSLSVDGSVSYHRGKNNHGKSLPMISPLTYDASLNYNKNDFSVSFRMVGNGTQMHFDSDFGEQHTDAFTIFSADVGKRFRFKNDDLFLKTGVQNIFDRSYTTYNNWDKIPQMGRNFYFNLTYNFN